MIKPKTINTYDIFTEVGKNINLSLDREKILLDIADCIVDEFEERNKVNLNFICTHNSRRSQLAQVWSFFAINYFKLNNLYAFSGGTETTSFHRNTVKCLQNSGFEFNVVDFSHQNPRYLISYKNTEKSILGFSKLFDNEENTFPYIAITTCNDANENCPFIPDALNQFHLPFEDPKASDNTKEQLEKYNQTSIKIAQEIYFIFNEVKNQLTETEI